MRPAAAGGTGRHRPAATCNIAGGTDGRAAQQLALLTGADPDLLLLTGCTGGQWAPGGGLRRDWETRLGMWSRGSSPPGNSAADSGSPYSLIFGRDRRVHHSAFKPVAPRLDGSRGSGMVEITVDGYPHGNTVLAVQSDPVCPKTRLSEAFRTAGCSAGLRPGPAIMGGDWTSMHGRPDGPGWRHLPPGDPEPDWDRLPEPLRLRQWLTGETGNRVIGAGGRMVGDRRPGNVLAAAGFRDGVAGLVSDPHARPATTRWEPGAVPLRADRIYLRHLTPAGGATVNPPRAAGLSSHYPVTLDIGLHHTTPATAAPSPLGSHEATTSTRHR